ncbi:ABC transporter substrate-binding protein [Embleya sp. NPDC059237]|uniref:ABC transporter substrate-binding protein n=1 Tax=Embleya sp. NPDC059237 TaxID=3346784 RepID=UPI0036911983
MTRKRSKRLVAVGATGVCVAALLTGCNGAEKPGAIGGKADHLRWGIVADSLDSVDPLTLTSGNALLATVYDALLTADAEGQLAPGLAESWDTPDALTYVFHLRKGVKFWDGTEMTSADVVASLDYDRLSPSPYESLFMNVANVTAKDPYTVVLTMKQAEASVLSLLASVGASIFQKKFHDEHKTDFGKPGTLTMATGPYRVDTLNPTEGAEFSANPDWWGGKPTIRKVSVKPFKTVTSAALAYRSGGLDAVYPLADPRAFAASSKAKPVSVPGCKQTFMSLNTQVDPWNDVHVRRAFAYALNRKDLAIAEGDDAVPYDSLLPAQVLAKVADKTDIDAMIGSLPTYGFDLTKAKEEIARSGHPDGVKGTFEVPEDGVRPKIAQAIAGMVAKAGIELDVKVLSEAQYTQRVGEGAAKDKVQLTIQRLDCSEEPNTTAGFLLDGSQADVAYANYAAYRNPEADKLVKAGISTTDRAGRFQAYSALDRLAAEDVPYIPLYLGKNALALSGRFAWPELNPFSSAYGPAAWVAQLKPAS